MPDHCFFWGMSAKNAFHGIDHRLAFGSEGNDNFGSIVEDPHRITRVLRVHLGADLLNNALQLLEVSYVGF